MMSGLDRLLRPRSIAVIGGGTWCANVIEQCQKIGFSGDIWPVHPNRAKVADLPAVTDVSMLPKAPDAAFVGINRDQTIDVVRGLSEIGTGGAVCFASGFRESEAETNDGASKQDALLSAAGDMAILGPNCYGFLNYLDGAALWPDQHGGIRVNQGIALVTQSSNIAINLTMQNRGLPIAYVVTAGNQAKTGISEISRALLRDDRVTAIGLHIEGIDDLREFEALAAEARARQKPIVVLKIGRSDQAQAATISHTASLAGSDAGARALLKRLGIGQVDTLPQLLETLKVLHVSGPLISNRAASMSCSGGEASLIADRAHGTGLVFPKLDKTQKQALRSALGPKVALANPLDYHTYIWNDLDAMTTCYTGMMQGDVAIGCVVLDFPRDDRCDASAWGAVIEAVKRTKAATGKPMAILSSLAENLPESTAQDLIQDGIIPFSGMDEAIKAIEVCVRLGQSIDAPEPLCLPPNAESTRMLSESDAKQALSLEGIEIPKAERANTPNDAAKMASAIGFPVVLKGENIAHKTEAGAVALNLNSAHDVIEAAKNMPTNSLLIEEMVTDTLVELLVGVVADPAHGYVLTLAAGGTLTEILHDRVSVLVPSSREEIQTALASLRIAPVLNGYRRKPPVNMNAIVDAIMATQNYVIKTRPQEVEINPLMCSQSRAVAADALIRTGELND